MTKTASAFSAADDIAKIHAYIDSGAGSVPEQNVRDWQRWRLVPRAFADVRNIDAGTEIFGHPASAPIVIAPTLGHRLLHDDGEAAAIAAARSVGVPFALSQGAGIALEEVGGPYLQQLYLPEEREALRPFIDRAVAAGAYALVLTVDQPAVSGHRFRSDAFSVLSLIQSPNFPDDPQSRLVISRHVTPDDIAWLRQNWGVPVLVKGILDPSSARVALDAGAAGVVVSNHGGRQLEGSTSPAIALPGIVEAVAGRGVVLADSGIRSGIDVFRALALGADAVLIGRPILHALGEGGAPSITQLLERFIEELRVTMANAGTPDIPAIDRGRVHDV